MKKGFTLIELLAVIVILAIIAVIAVPIVLNIIDESKRNSLLRSAAFYLDAVELSVGGSTLKDKNIADGEYNILPSGNICLEYENNTCIDELTVEVNGEVPTSGTITIQNGNIASAQILLSGKTIVKNEKGELVYQEESTGPCTLKSGKANTIGAKYSCDFGGGEREFYILELGSDPVSDSTLESDEVALILAENYDATTHTYCNQSGPYPNMGAPCRADGLTDKLDEIANVWTKLERSQIVLPSASQITDADGQRGVDYNSEPKVNYVVTEHGGYYDYQYKTVTLTNEWLYKFSDVYWTSTPCTFYDVSGNGSVYSGGSGACVVTSSGQISISAANEKKGVRPVVNIKL